MPGTTIGITMDYGYPGQASRHGDEVSRTRPVSADSAEIKFGAPVAQNDDGSVTAWKADTAAVKFAGIALRKVKGATVWPYQNFGAYKAQEPVTSCSVAGCPSSAPGGPARRSRCLHPDQSGRRNQPCRGSHWRPGGCR